MTDLNPYASFLNGQDPLKVLATTPRHIEQIIDGLGEERSEAAPAPGKWSPREIVCHLADTEQVFAFRLRQTLAEDHHTIQPFDQTKWGFHYAAYEMRDALTAFGAVRSWNLALLRALSPDVHTKPVTHPERGTMTFHTIVETMAGHDRNHLSQLEAILKKFAPAH